jgi:hypothetical protein
MLIDQYCSSSSIALDLETEKPLYRSVIGNVPVSFDF